MTLACVYSRAPLGIEALLVTVEVHMSLGLPGLAMVGLAQTAVKESKDRVRSALLNSGYEFPTRKLTINLAPADLPKGGGRFDLAIAIGILSASGQFPLAALSQYEAIAELALTGHLRPVSGVLPAALAATQAGRALIVAKENAAEASLVQGARIVAADHLLSVAEHIMKEKIVEPVHVSVIAATKAHADLSEVAGQWHAKRALEIAAMGNHHVLFVGPPGTGKTLLASRLPSLLPPMSDAEAQECAAIYSMSHVGFDANSWRVRPFRSPHHSASAVALVGGGSPPRPGEISLAHHGVLFLDELPEFQRHVLDSLREPLESHRIIVSRASYQTTFPANFQLIAAMNPCPCGFSTDPDRPCRCTPDQVARYRARLSGPFLDRIDIHISVQRLPLAMMQQELDKTESSFIVRARVDAARTQQYVRAGKTNAELNARELARDAALSSAEQLFLTNTLDALHFSARSYHRVLRVARTIADAAARTQIEREDLAEAIQYANGGI